MRYKIDAREYLLCGLPEAAQRSRPGVDNVHRCVHPSHMGIWTVDYVHGGEYLVSYWSINDADEPWLCGQGRATVKQQAVLDNTLALVGPGDIIILRPEGIVLSVLRKTSE